MSACVQVCFQAYHFKPECVRPHACALCERVKTLRLSARQALMAAVAANGLPPMDTPEVPKHPSPDHCCAPPLPLPHTPPFP